MEVSRSSTPINQSTLTSLRFLALEPDMLTSWFGRFFRIWSLIEEYRSTYSDLYFRPLFGKLSPPFSSQLPLSRLLGVMRLFKFPFRKGQILITHCLPLRQPASVHKVPQQFATHVMRFEFRLSTIAFLAARTLPRLLLHSVKVCCCTRLASADFYELLHWMSHGHGRRPFPWRCDAAQRSAILSVLKVCAQ